MLSTPGGTPAFSASSARAKAEKGVASGFEDDGAAGCEGWGAFSGDHRGGEIPGGNGSDDADRLFENEEVLVFDGRGDDVSVDSFGFFRVPLDETGSEWISVRASARGFPCSLVMRSARSSVCSRMSSNQRRRI